MRVVAGFPGGGLLRLFPRIICVTGGIIGVWFVASLLTAGGGTARAADLPESPEALEVVAGAPIAAVSTTVDAGEGGPAAGTLQASPSSVSASANRRAVIDQVVVDAGLASLPVADQSPRVAPDPNVEPAAPESSTPLSLTPPIVPIGTPDGRADSGPSGSHLAVITAALMAVVWLTRQLHVDAHRWRSVRVSTRIERPG